MGFHRKRWMSRLGTMKSRVQALARTCNHLLHDSRHAGAIDAKRLRLEVALTTRLRPLNLKPE